MEQRGTPPGITAVVTTHDRHVDLDSAVLDLAAVLDGLVADRFEIIVVDVECEGRPNDRTPDVVDGLRVRWPRLPLRMLEQRYADRECALAAGFDAAAHDLIFAAAPNGEFDVRELNHLFEAIERGADLAVGYRKRRADGVVRRLQGWGWNVVVNLVFGAIGRDVGCSFKLFRRTVWTTVAMHPRSPSSTFCAELLIRARRLGFRVTEVPVSHHRTEHGDLPCGAATPTEVRRALTELNALRRDLQLEKTQPARDPAAGVAVSADRRAA